MVTRQDSGTLKLDGAEYWVSKPGGRTGVPTIKHAGKDTPQLISKIDQLLCK